MKEHKTYHPEPYWSEVAERIEQRGAENVIAGDDEPFYRYKREKFLKLLHSLDFSGKKVLEIGCGPGGNLNEIAKRGDVKELCAVDISDSMIKLARKNTKGKVKAITKINGQKIPYPDNTFDIVFSATVLQHNTDHAMMEQILSEMCRVSKRQVVLFEQIDNPMSGDSLCYWRPVSAYQEIAEKNGLQLIETKFIDIYISYLVSGSIRKGLNPSTRKEGEPLNGFSIFLQNITLPITKQLDKVFKAKKDVAKLVFQKK